MDAKVASKPGVQAEIVSTEVTYEGGDRADPKVSNVTSKASRRPHSGYSKYAVVVMASGMFPLGFFVGWADSLSLTLYNDQFPFRAIVVVYAAITITSLIDAVVIQFFAAGPLGRVSGKCLLILYPTVVIIGIIMDIVAPGHVWTSLVWFAIMAIFMGRLPAPCLTYVIECSKKRWRGAAGCLVYMFFTLGMSIAMITQAFSKATNPRAFSVHGILAACFYFIHLLLLYSLRESPWFYMEVGEQVEADLSIAWLRGDDPYMDAELTEMEIYMSNDLTISGSAMASAWIGLNCILMSVLTGSFLVIHIYPQALDAYSMHPRARGIGAIWSAQFLGALCAVFLVDRFGRKMLLYTTLAVMCCCLIVLGVWSAFYQSYNSVNRVAMIMAIVYSTAFGMGPGTVSLVLLSELMPVAVRNVLTSVLFVIFWMATFVFYFLSRVFPILDWVKGLLFAFYALFCMERMFYVGVRYMFPETARRSLPKIQYILSEM